ncbi:Piso0_003133 [Millerozyma farinosa CBS 7064]|uniref:Piso0_003133 protein n=1 Tax=Pichia sorbitophila (strain ATCC MYA-4447 / BCRC 22081 / CBS 7064 / NBRC 10061 / NRRL Y-12695) TaxID=559304 RepID=G8YKF6_PICSO|nr:Piso0_003133 [Millerozyma farinosa CBS 7064]CCE80801.1 Piso0_003133 [Millerozyma farinosa CBS 7064]
MKCRKLLQIVIYNIIITQVSCLGLIIPPIRAGDTSKYSSVKNLYNCVSYMTLKDDIVIARLVTGERVPSQKLNVRIFDGEENQIRFKEDIYHEYSFIFTNLHNPRSVQHDSRGQSKRRNFLQKLPYMAPATGKQKERAEEIMNSHLSKSFIHICFDNTYSDKSWSFHPQERQVELYVDIKNKTTFSQTNYNQYARFFNKHTETDRKDRSGFTANDFENSINVLKTELNEVTSNLENSESILKTLMEHEYKLRDTNESIFTDYTMNSVIILSVTFIFGIIQLTYLKYYLKKRKVI